MHQNLQRPTSLRCSHKLRPRDPSAHSLSPLYSWIDQNVMEGKGQRTQLEQKGGQGRKILFNSLQHQGYQGQFHHRSGYGTSETLTSCRLECKIIQFWKTTQERWKHMRVFMTALLAIAPNCKQLKLETANRRKEKQIAVFIQRNGAQQEKGTWRWDTPANLRVEQWPWEGMAGRAESLGAGNALEFDLNGGSTAVLPM